jgi:hypothetical protein
MLLQFPIRVRTFGRGMTVARLTITVRIQGDIAL